MRIPVEVDPEASLVFGLACRDGNSVAVGQLVPRAGWQRLVQLASDENAIIALRDRLGSDAAPVPLGLERHVAMLALDRTHHMQVLQARLEQSLAALNAAGIEVILLKGAALACTMYGSFVARPMRDIDLLVQNDRANDARAVLLDLGWESDPDLPGDQLYGGHQHLPPLRDARARGMCLEIHRSLLASGHPFRFKEDLIWKASESVAVGSAHARVMHPAHHGVYLAIHFAWSHRLKTGGWHTFRDLDALTTGGALDWQTLAETAQQWGASSCCYWTLYLGRELSGLGVPESLLRQLQPRMPALMRRALTRHLLNGVLQNAQVCPSMRLDQVLWSLAMQPSRDGHGAIRPWLLARELTSAFTERARQEDQSSADSALIRARRTTRYLAGLLM